MVTAAGVMTVGDLASQRFEGKWRGPFPAEADKVRLVTAVGWNTAIFAPVFQNNSRWHARRPGALRAWCPGSRAAASRCPFSRTTAFSRAAAFSKATPAALMSEVIFPYGSIVALLDTVPRGARDVRALAVHARRADDLPAGEALPLVPRAFLGETTFDNFRLSGHRKVSGDGETRQE